MENNVMHAERAPWGDFPPVIRNDNLNTLSAEPEYLAAKAGDMREAFVLVDKVMKESFVKEVSIALGDRKPKIVPVLAMEASGGNKIPLMAAKLLAARLGLEVELNITQAGKAFRTNSGADHRLVFNPVFTGMVEKDQEYVILDDTLSVGGTIAALRGYIENRGGKVVLATAMTAHEGALDLKIKPGMLDAIKRKHGDAMDNLWKERFGYGIDQLCNGEAGHLKAAASVEHMRERLDAAYSAGVVQHGANPAFVGRARSVESRHESSSSLCR